MERWTVQLKMMIEFSPHPTIFKINSMLQFCTSFILQCSVTRLHPESPMSGPHRLLASHRGVRKPRLSGVTTSKVATMSDIPADVIVYGILTRVPAKTAVQSKTVCKQWCALLSTRDFERAHSSQSSVPNNQRTLLLDDLSFHVHPMDFETGEYGPHSVLPLPFQGVKKEVWILANLDGLLCVCLSQTHELLLWNPTTAAYRHLATPAGHGVYEDNADTVGLYSNPSNDYNLLHLTRRSGVLAAHIYSRQQGNWRKIAFKTNPAYHTRKFCWSPATLCAGTLYFTICECWVVGRNVVIGFDTSTEQVTEISFPHVPSSGIFQGVLVTVRNSLHMVLWTGREYMSLSLWALQGQNWVRLLSTPAVPPIPFDAQLKKGF
uniref:Putative F-box domain-containing protein n=1 Tax=Helianthus annuus TaxID=4232 RepID=A0A251V3S4_HELAN